MTTEVLTDATQASAPVTPADVTESTPSADELAEARTALGLETQGVSTESASTGTEPQVDDDVKDLLDKAKAAAAEEAEARGREAERKSHEAEATAREQRNRVEGIEKAFRETAQAIRGFARDKGLEPEDAERLVATFNAHHAQSSVVVSKEYWDGTIDYAVRKLDEASAKSILADYNAAKFESFPQLLDRIIEASQKAATTGHYTKLQLEEKEALAYIRGKRAAQAPGARGTQPTSHIRGVADTRTEDELLLDPNTPITKVQEIMRSRGLT